MTNHKPEESTRTALGAAIIRGLDSNPSLSLRSILSGARTKSTVGAVVFAGVALWAGYKAYNDVTAPPPAYGPATAFALLAVASTFSAKRSVRRVLMTNHYLAMEAAKGPYITTKKLREFAAPSLKLFENAKL